MGLVRFAQFSHLVKADVNTIIVNHAADQSKMAWGPQRSLVTKPVFVFCGKGLQDEMVKVKNSSRNPAKQRRKTTKRRFSRLKKVLSIIKKAFVGAMNTLG